MPQHIRKSGFASAKSQEPDHTEHAKQHGPQTLRDTQCMCYHPTTTPNREGGTLYCIYHSHALSLSTGRWKKYLIWSLQTQPWIDIVYCSRTPFNRRRRRLTVVASSTPRSSQDSDASRTSCAYACATRSWIRRSLRAPHHSQSIAGLLSGRVRAILCVQWFFFVVYVWV